MKKSEYKIIFVCNIYLGRRCPSKPRVPNAHTNDYPALANSIIRYTCDTGFFLTPHGLTELTTTCNGDSWTPIEGECQGKYHYILYKD